MTCQRNYLYTLGFSERFSSNIKYKKPSSEFSDRKNIPEFSAEYPEIDYEVEKILDHRTFKKKLQYKIRWKGWSPEHDSWEPAENINASELLRDYQQSRGGVASGPSPNPFPDKTRPDKTSPKPTVRLTKPHRYKAR